jgi:hypothetical protein
MGPFGLTYARLVEQGYAVLPIMPGTKKPGLPCGSDAHGNEKWMGFPDWTTFPSTPVHHKLWAKSTAGIAILTGGRSGDAVALDNDSDDPAIAAALRKVLPDTPVRKKGAKGDTGFYYGPGIPSRSWTINGRKVVEILGTGRQTVLPPTIHPEAGEPYQWTGSKTLEELRPEELPRLSADVVELIDAALAPFGYVPPEVREPRREYDGLDGLDGYDAADDPHRRLNEAALANLRDWVPALGLYNCRPRAGGGYEAVATWRPSTKGRDKRVRNRNLKIAPDGIRDFGADQGYTAIDLVMAARECDLDAAFIFLSEHLDWSGGEPLLDISLDMSKVEMLGLSDDDGGSQASAPQVSAQVIPLFKPAAPSIVPSIPPPIPPEIPPWRSFQESEKGDDSEASSTSTVPSDPELERLTYVPGLLGDIIDWIVANARLPNRVLALAAALIVIGTLIGRRAMGPTGSATHLYIAMVARASGGKDWPCKAAQMLIKAAGAGAHLHPGDITAQSALHRVLTKMPLCAVVINELIRFLNRIVNPRSNGYEQSLVGNLCDLWSTRFTEYGTTTSAQSDLVTVQSPAISLFGTATPDAFWQVLRGAQVAAGLFSRFLVFESYVRPDEQLFLIEPNSVPATLKDDLTELYQFGNNSFEMAKLNDSNIRPDPQPQDWVNAEAKGVYSQLNKWVRGEIDKNPSQEEYLGRITEQAMRLTMIRAAGIAGHRGKVDAAGMTWGGDLASILITRAMKRSQASLPQTARGQFVENLVSYIISQGSVTRRELQQHIKGRYSTRDIADMLKGSIEAGDIILTPNGYAAPPKSTTKK